jgi:hypothetical protein
VFSENNQTYAIYRNHFKTNKNLLRTVKTKVESAAVSEKFFLKKESFRSNLQLLVFNLQVFNLQVKIAPCLGGLRRFPTEF